HFRDDAEAIGAPSLKGRPEPPAEREHELLRERLATAPCFFTDLLAELDLAPEQIQEALWDLVWAGEVTNDAWAPLRAPRLSLARSETAGRTPARRAGRSRFAARRSTGAQSQVQGRWSLTAPVFGAQDDAAAAPERRRTVAE